MDPSITTWNRIEPNPRKSGVKPDLARSVAAQVRDPLWFLTRQWQFGEFRGEDAASPQYVQAKLRYFPLTGWRPSNSPNVGFEPFDEKNPAPWETVMEREGFYPNLSTAVELGLEFERLLMESELEGFYSCDPSVLPGFSNPIKTWLTRILGVSSWSVGIG